MNYGPGGVIPTRMSGSEVKSTFQNYQINIFKNKNIKTVSMSCSMSWLKQNLMSLVFKLPKPKDPEIFLCQKKIFVDPVYGVDIPELY